MTLWSTSELILAKIRDGLSTGRQIRLFINQLNRATMQIRGSYDELSPFVALRVSGQQVEQCGHIRTDVFVGREEAEVGVELCRGWVVVARAQVHVTLDYIIFLADDHRDLTVGLHIEEAVHDVHAGLLKLPGPADVRFLVKSCLKFNQRCHMLAGLSRVGQRLHDRRVTAGSIQRLFDRQDLRVLSGSDDEVDNRRRSRRMDDATECPVD